MRKGYEIQKIKATKKGFGRFNFLGLGRMLAKRPRGLRKEPPHSQDALKNASNLHHLRLIAKRKIIKENVKRGLLDHNQQDT